MPSSAASRPTHGTAPRKHRQDLEDVADATKDAIKRNAKKVQHAIRLVTPPGMTAVQSAKNKGDNVDDPKNPRSEKDCGGTKKPDKQTTTKQDEQTITEPGKQTIVKPNKRTVEVTVGPLHTDHHAAASGLHALELAAALLSAHHIWTCRHLVLSNQFPASVVCLLTTAAFLLGGRLAAVPPRRGAPLFVRAHSRRARLSTSRAVVTTTTLAPSDRNEPGGRIRRSLGRGGSVLRRFGRKFFVEPLDKVVEPLGAAIQDVGGSSRVALSRGQLMGHLLKHPDFRRRKITESSRLAGIESNVKGDGGGAADGGGDGAAGEKGKAEGAVGGDRFGAAPLHNAHANSLQKFDQHFSHQVEPLSQLRGMDLFLTDAPEVDIWRQPLLQDCGLRETPTIIFNMMMPFGNMTAYLNLPEWVRDWENIPEEKDDDPPDIKAFKRFLAGDDEYRNARMRIVPHIVDGPLVIRLLPIQSPEVLIHGAGHPVAWRKVAGRAADDARPDCDAAPLLECDIDLLTGAKIRKMISLVRPHLSKVTIDLALIISTPCGAEVEEPSACLALWRIEKVNFEEAAVFPELPVEDALEEVKTIMQTMTPTEAARTKIVS